MGRNDDFKHRIPSGCDNEYTTCERCQLLFVIKKGSKRTVCRDCRRAAAKGSQDE